MSVLTQHAIVEGTVGILHMKVAELKLLTVVVYVLFLCRMTSCSSPCLLCLLVVHNAMLLLGASLDTLNVVFNNFLFFQLDHAHRLLPLAQLILKHDFLHLLNFNFQAVITVQVT